MHPTVHRIGPPRAEQTVPRNRAAGLARRNLQQGRRLLPQVGLRIVIPYLFQLSPLLGAERQGQWSCHGYLHRPAYHNPVTRLNC